MTDKQPLDKIPLPTREYKPAEMPAVKNRVSAYAPMLFGILMVVVTLLVVIWAATQDEDELADINLMPTANEVCLVIAQKMVNVRVGPGLDYGRAWMLGLGEQRQAVAQAGTDWLQIPKGWIAREDVGLQSGCANLPTVESPEIFEDDLTPPASILARGWGESFGENFATMSNGWMDANGQAGFLFEGALLLQANAELAPTNPNIMRYEDAYYLFEMVWEVSEANGVFIFTFGGNETGEYQLNIWQEGKIQLMRNEHEIETAQVEKIPLNQPLVVGVLADGTQLEMYWQDDLLFSIEDEGLKQGTYAVQMQAGSGVLRRFEINTLVP